MPSPAPTKPGVRLRVWLRVDTSQAPYRSRDERARLGAGHMNAHPPRRRDPRAPLLQPTKPGVRLRVWLRVDTSRAPYRSRDERARLGAGHMNAHPPRRRDPRAPILQPTKPGVRLRVWLRVDTSRAPYRSRDERARLGAGHMNAHPPPSRDLRAPPPRPRPPGQLVWIDAPGCQSTSARPSSLWIRASRNSRSERRFR